MNHLIKRAGILKIFSYLLITVAIILIFLTSCTHGWQTYIVKRGHHSKGDINAIKLNLNSIRFEFKADSSWYYNLPDNAGWNKLRGFSQGHHQNNSSVRLGYKCIGDSMLVVGAYCYINGVSPQENESQKQIIDTIQPGRVYHCKISCEKGNYIIDFEHRRWSYKSGKDMGWGYLLNPYIGGEFTLDHDWTIELKDD
jgi:hypothetical protein